MWQILVACWVRNRARFPILRSQVKSRSIFYTHRSQTVTLVCAVSALGVNIWPIVRPLLLPKHNNRYSLTGQVLPEAHMFVGGEKKSRSERSRDRNASASLAVFQFRKSLFHNSLPLHPQNHLHMRHGCL